MKKVQTLKSQHLVK